MNTENNFLFFSSQKYRRFRFKVQELPAAKVYTSWDGSSSLVDATLPYVHILVTRFCMDQVKSDEIAFYKSSSHWNHRIGPI
jgi:hypothetical protein